MSTFWESTKEKLGVVLITAAVSLATVFSDRIVGSIKSEVNKADQRPAHQEAMAKDISIFIFTAENALEFLQNDETTKAQLHFVVDPYNDAVVSLRKNEYVYLAAVQRYWDKPVVKQFETFFTDVRGVDAAFHAFNDEFATVEAGTKAKADDAKIRPLVTGAAAAVAKVEQSSKQLLTALSK